MRVEVRWTTGGQVCLTLHQRPSVALGPTGENTIPSMRRSEAAGLSGPDNFRSDTVSYPYAMPSYEG